MEDKTGMLEKKLDKRITIVRDNFNVPSIIGSSQSTFKDF